MAAIPLFGPAGAEAEPPDPAPATRPAGAAATTPKSRPGYSCAHGGPVAKFVHRRGRRTTNGTVTCLAEGAITAAHVVTTWPGTSTRPTRHDMVWLSRSRPLAPQTPLRPGDRVTLLGFAERDVARPQRRTGAVLREWKPGEWLVVLDDGQPATRNGMSGGAVLDSAGRVRGIVVTRNRRVDLDGDGRREHSSIVVDLAAWN